MSDGVTACTTLQVQNVAASDVARFFLHEQILHCPWFYA